MTEWAVQLSPPHAVQWLARVRDRTDLTVCRTQDEVWLRGATGPDALILALPGRHFEVLADSQLVLRGQRVPTHRLPEDDWTPIAEWIVPERPVPQFAAGDVKPIALRLVRAVAQVAANAVLADFCDWQNWVLTAPQIRLKRLMFCADRDHRVLVRGTPLPPLRGIQFVITDGLAIPAGLRCVPSVPAKTARRAFAAESSDIVLWESDDDWSLVPHDAFVQASRRAVRATAAQLESSP